MSAATTQDKRPRRASKPPIYARALEVDDPRNGEKVLALLPATITDAQQPAWRRIRPGDRRRLEITSPRNPGFHMAMHGIAKLACENIEELSHLDPHATIKRLQAEAGLECDVVMLDASSMWEQITQQVSELLPDPATAVALEMIGELLAGQQLAVKWPRSIAFDAMDEDPFRALAQGICRHLSRRYWPTCTPEQIAEMAKRHMGDTP